VKVSEDIKILKYPNFKILISPNFLLTFSKSSHGYILSNPIFVINSAFHISLIGSEYTVIGPTSIILILVIANLTANTIFETHSCVSLF
jgi:hypothetical protein